MSESAKKCDDFRTADLDDVFLLSSKDSSTGWMVKSKTFDFSLELIMIDVLNSWIDGSMSDFSRTGSGHIRSFPIY